MNSNLWTPSFFETIRNKCKQFDWADEAFRRFREPNIDFSKNALDIPLIGGGWSHNYNCPKDGSRLVLRDRHHHQCPTCEAVWSGSPWDEVAIANEHWRNSMRCRDAAILFGLEGDSAWAESARTILFHYARHYEDYPLHDKLGGTAVTSGKVQCQTLSESSWLTPIAQAFTILKLQEALSHQEQKDIETQLLRPALEVIRRNPMSKSNWQTYHNAAKALVAAALDDQGLMDEAVNDPDNGFIFQMENSLADDGFWHEGSWGYHFYTLEAQVMIVIAGLSFNMKLYEHPRFQAMFQAPLACMFPDGTLPAVHDSGEVKLDRYTHLFELSHTYFGIGERMVIESPRHTLYSLLFGQKLENNEKPLQESRREFVDLKRSGMIFLNWDAPAKEQRQMAMVDYGEHGGEHGHQDKLNILFYAKGHPWLTDAGTMPYGNAMHKGFFKHTAAHNTVAVGARSQEQAEGKLLSAHADGTAFMETVAEVEGTYPGVFMQRRIIMADSLLFDVFHVHCEQARDVDWIIHTQGHPIVGPDGARTATHLSEGSLGTLDGYDYFSNIQLLDLSGFGKVVGWQWDKGAHASDRLSLHLLDCIPGEEIFLAESPALPHVRRRSTLIRRRKQVTDTLFVALFRVRQDGEPDLHPDKISDYVWSLPLHDGDRLKLRSRNQN